MTSLVEAHHSDKGKIDCVLTGGEVERATRRLRISSRGVRWRSALKKLNSGLIAAR
jgi:hypothetical protein